MATTWLNRAMTSYGAISASGIGTSITETTLALDSAYTYASAGDAFFGGFVCRESGNLTDFWVKVSGYTGTWGSTDGVINVEIREGLNGNSIPGTTLTGSFTITLDGSTSGWIKKSGLSIALTAGKYYTYVIGDADGGASNFVTMVRHYSNNSISTHPISNGTVVATNGFATTGTLSSGLNAFVAKVGSDLYCGSAFSSVATVTSGTYERGLRFRPAEDCELVGVHTFGSDVLFWNANVSAIKLYADGTAPGGSTLKTVTPAGTFTGTTPVPNGLMFATADRVSLTGGTWYRLALDYSGNLTIPRKTTIGGSPDADVVAAAMPFNGDAHWIEEAAGPSWDDSNTASLPLLSPLILPKTASAGGTTIAGTPMRRGMV